MSDVSWIELPRTREAIRWLRSLIGVELSPKEPFFNTQATKDGIRHFVDGIGDPNPLWRDEGYAKNTRWGRVIAPPSYLYTVYDPGAGQHILGNHFGAPVSMFNGNKWEWYQPMLEGDTLAYTQKLTDVGEKVTRAFGKMFTKTAVTIYRNQRDEVVATAEGWIFQGDYATSENMGKRRAKATYTSDQLAEIRRAYDAEEIRADNPRYWEDVQVGDSLTPVVKGPLTQMDLLAFQVGRPFPWVKAHRLDFEYQERYKDLIKVDPGVHGAGMGTLQHSDELKAQQAGFATGYDWGGQRMSWLINLLTHWMGDDGFITKLDVRLREPNFLGDTTWLKGRVLAKRLEQGQHLVDIECWGQNQLEQVTMPGSATIRLPARGSSQST